jgi:hypothetical protein
VDFKAKEATAKPKFHNGSQLTILSDRVFFFTFLEVGFGHEEHATDEVCGGDALRSLHLPKKRGESLEGFEGMARRLTCSGQRL